ncbi:hypothetical protein GCM10009605_21430 [Nocardiopsis composta]
MRHPAISFLRTTRRELRSAYDAQAPLPETARDPPRSPLTADVQAAPWCTPLRARRPVGLSTGEALRVDTTEGIGGAGA